jgi:hypothetical protein
MEMDTSMRDTGHELLFRVPQATSELMRKELKRKCAITRDSAFICAMVI